MPETRNNIATRKRIFYGFAILIVLPLGLATRKVPHLFPVLIAEYGGDVLWATLVYLLFAFVFVNKAFFENALYAIIFSYFIEISQLFHPQWLKYLRHTTLGALVLGEGFLWSDFVCYTLGVGVGVLLSMVITKMKFT